MRLAVVSLVVVLVGLVWWMLSGPSNRRTPRVATSAPALGLTVESAAKPSGGLGFGSGNMSGLGARESSWSMSGTFSTFPVRAQEPDTYTALVGDGPVSESGPGTVTDLYPPSRVSYITTTAADTMPEFSAPPDQSLARERERQRERDAEADRINRRSRGETGPPRGASLDAAIEGGLGTGTRDVPGQIR